MVQNLFGPIEGQGIRNLQEKLENNMNLMKSVIHNKNGRDSIFHASLGLTGQQRAFKKLTWKIIKFWALDKTGFH